MPHCTSAKLNSPGGLIIVNFPSTLTPSPWLLKTMTVTEKLLLFCSENYINTNGSKKCFSVLHIKLRVYVFFLLMSLSVHRIEQKVTSDLSIRHGYAQGPAHKGINSCTSIVGPGCRRISKISRAKSNESYNHPSSHCVEQSPL